MPARKSTTPSEATVVKGELVELLSQAQPLTTTTELPPILAGSHTPTIQRKVRQFYVSIEGLFDLWLRRHEDSAETMRAYRRDIFSLLEFLGITWPKQSGELLRITVTDVLNWKEDMLKREMAPKTINRRIASVSSLYRYIGAAASELRLPITIPNPAHSQFIPRLESDPLKETKPLTATKVRQLVGMPDSESITDYRDRAILKFYLYSAARISAGCRLTVSDFHYDEENPTIRLKTKGGKTQTIGIHYAAAEAIRDYLAAAEITKGHIFRPRLGSRGQMLANRALHVTAMHDIVSGYLQRLPGAMVTVGHDENGESIKECIYTPHSIRATTATLLLDAGVDIAKVQELLGHKHVTTTQIYDKRRRTTKESASHDVPV